jgi:hypothetical protein
MLVPMIMSIWFAYLAHKYGKGVIEWALGGAFLTLIVNTVFLEASLLLFSDLLTGSSDLNIYLVTRIAPSIITVVVMLLVGKIFLTAKYSETATPSADDGKA